MAIAVPTLALIVGAVLGAHLDRSRSRAGYMSKRYRDYLESLFNLAAARDAAAHDARADDLEDDAAPHSKEKSPAEKEKSSRSVLQPDLYLFGSKRAQKLCKSLWTNIDDGKLPDQAQVAELAEGLRGRFRIAPEKRWFR